MEAANEMMHRSAQHDEDVEETDEARNQRELRYTAKLIVKHLKNTVTDEETKYPHLWAELSPANAELLASLSKSADTEFLCNHFSKYELETHYWKRLKITPELLAVFLMEYCKQITMSDNKSNTGQQDRIRVDSKDASEIEYLHRQFPKKTHQ
ncbi:MAG: hypothetical protein M3N30_07950, partial [Bacteroidota bacterium]|nr:hypothetical protein [Bacteroidota bacterium]